MLIMLNVNIIIE